MSITSAEIGDIAIVAVDRHSCVVSKDEAAKTYRLKILSKLKMAYVVFVPHYVHIPHARKLTRQLSQQFNIDDKYIGCLIVTVAFDSVLRVIIATDGMNCCICKKFYTYAEPNQEDGTLICYTCRDNPYRYRKSEKNNKF